MIEADTPTLWDIRRTLGHPAAAAILVNAFIHAAKLVSLDKNLTQEQIGEASNDILENYGYLKVEEVKFLLKRALRTQSLYGRLDYTVIMQWVAQYDSERTEEAIRISEQKASQELNEPRVRPDAVSYETYLFRLRERAKTDKEAAELLEGIENPPPQRLTLLTDEERAKKEHDFKTWRVFNYLQGDKQ